MTFGGGIGPHPGLGPGRSPVAAQFGERGEAGASHWGLGGPSADTHIPRHRRRLHFHIGKAFPKQLPDPTASGRDVFGGGAEWGRGVAGAAWASEALCPGVLLLPTATPGILPSLAGGTAQSPPHPRASAGAHVYSSPPGLWGPGQTSQSGGAVPPYPRAMSCPWWAHIIVE